MPISRPCYDKPHRCPGWAGGGWTYARTDRCAGGRVSWPHGLYWWPGRCETCGMIVLPYVVSLTSPYMWKWHIKYRAGHLADWWRYDRHRSRRWRRLIRIILRP